MSLSTDAFNEESLSSVLHFNPSMMAVPLLDAGTSSDTTSQIIAALKNNNENGRRPMEITVEYFFNDLIFYFFSAKLFFIELSKKYHYCAKEHGQFERTTNSDAANFQKDESGVTAPS